MLHVVSNVSSASLCLYFTSYLAMFNKGHTFLHCVVHIYECKYDKRRSISVHHYLTDFFCFINVVSLTCLSACNWKSEDT